MYYPGTILLWTATLLGIASTISFALAIRREEQPWRERGRQAFALMTVAVVLASVLLMYLLLTHDYRLAYIWSYSDSSLPLHYLISCFWAGQEGSFLLWALCSVLLGLPLMAYAKHYESRVMLFYNLTLVSLLVLLLKQSPFRFHEGLVSGSIPPDGNGLNPLLQNPWMVLHPPVMFVGYASLAIPFAFALAGLWMRRYEEWMRISLPWVLVSLLTLGAAIMTGGYWAYETLGWGGYWAWDPVENASLVPWLLTVALAHGMLLQRASQRFRRLNIFLAIMAFLTVVYATFLTRSGILADFSVHSFVDLGLMGWLVFIMAFFLLLSVGMLVWRWREIPVEIGTEPFFSRTIFLVLGIIVLVFIGLVVGVGTSSPIFTGLWGEPSQLAPEFYNRTGFWEALALALILGIAPLLTWHKPKEGSVLRAKIAGGITLVTLVLAFTFGLRLPMAFLYLAAVVFLIATAGTALIDKLRDGSWRKTGAALAHFGTGLMLLAFMTTGWLGREQKVQLQQDKPAQVLDYTMTFKGRVTNELGREEMRVEVTTPGGKTTTLAPVMWINRKSNQLVANPDIKTFPFTDVYLAPSEYQPPEEPAPVAGVLVQRDTPLSYHGWTIAMAGFETGMHGAAAGGISVAVQLQLTPPGGEEPIELQPRFIIRGAGQAERPPEEIPGTDGATVRVLRIDADRGQVRLELLGIGEEPAPAQGKPATLVIDVSTKPLILLVWIGTILILLGTLLAISRRWKDVAAISQDQDGAAA